MQISGGCDKHLARLRAVGILPPRNKVTAHLRKTAERACRAAADIQLRLQREGFEVGSKALAQDRVTDADILAENAVVEIIKTTFPDHGILAEEGGHSEADSPYVWVIDPVDGTTNFSRGLPFYCVSVAVVKDGLPIVGAVLDPVRDELFTAIAGGGAFLNGAPIRVSDVTSLADALLVSGFFYDRGEAMVRNLENIRRFFELGILGIRRLGSAALDMCYVACGRADAFWEHELNAWDFAAAGLIVREAGGTITDLHGDALQMKPSYVVASNTRLHEMVREELLAE